jgi:hypothetical protein
MYPNDPTNIKYSIEPKCPIPSTHGGPDTTGAPLAAASATHHLRTARDPTAGRTRPAGRDRLRTDDSSRCELLVVRDTSGSLALYPHGGSTFGVRLPKAGVATMLKFLTGTQ